MKFGTRVRLKPSNDRGEFELDRTKSKNNIAENWFALGHETHNRQPEGGANATHVYLKDTCNNAKCHRKVLR